MWELRAEHKTGEGRVHGGREPSTTANNDLSLDSLQAETEAEVCK